VTWTQKNMLTGQSFLSQVTIEAYQPNEPIIGVYPLNIEHQTLIGNTVTTVGGGSTTLQNDNNISGTQVYESTVAGSPGSNVILQNQGLIEVLQWIGGVLTQIFKTDPGASSVVKLGNTGLTTESLGNMTVDQVLSVIGNTSLSTLLTSGLATLNSLSVTNGATVGGTLGVTGATSLSTLLTSGLATLNSASVTNNETVGGTLQVTGASSLDGGVVVENAVALQWEDSTDAARTVMQVDSGNNVQIFGVTGNDKVQFLKHDGTLEVFIDLVNGLLNVTGTKQTANGSVSGTMDVYEWLSGAVKLVIMVQTNYRNAASSNFITLKTAFSTVAAIFNLGMGPINTATAGVAGNVRQITWATGTGSGSQSAATQINQDAAGFTVGGGFTQVGDAGGYASAFGGVGIYVGV